MRLVWTAAAVRDLAAIREYLQSENPGAADRQIRSILAGVDRLLRFPEIGREGRVADTRELVIALTPYLVPYRRRGETIEIARVLHGRQRWPGRF